MPNTQLDVRAQAYSKIILPLARQEGSKLFDRVYAKMDVVGKSFYQDQIGRWTMTPKGGSNIDTPKNDPNLSRTRLDILTYIDSRIFDRSLQLQEIADPTSEIVTCMKSAIGLQYDSLIINALLGNAYRGEAGGSTVPLSNTVAVDFEASGSNTGLTVAKIAEAGRIMDAGGVPSEDRTLVISAKGKQQLLGSTKATSSDYQNVKALVQGAIDTFYGFKVVTLEDNLLPVASDVTTCIAFQKTGLCLGTTEEMFMDVDIRKDLAYSKQVFYEINAGAARLEEAKVVAIYADNTKVVTS